MQVSTEEQVLRFSVTGYHTTSKLPARGSGAKTSEEILETEKQLATHVLWLGLHHNNETWMTATYPMEEVLRSMGVVEEKEVKQGKEPKEQPKKKNSRKTKENAE